jgi:hypothetical protein
LPNQPQLLRSVSQGTKRSEVVERSAASKTLTNGTERYHRGGNSRSRKANAAEGSILDSNLRIGFYDSDMHEKHKIEKKLKIEAARISAELGDAPVVIIVGGSETAKIPHTMTASCINAGRLRDFLGLLQASMQIVSRRHFQRRRNKRGEAGF